MTEMSSQLLSIGVSFSFSYTLHQQEIFTDLKDKGENL